MADPNSNGTVAIIEKATEYPVLEHNRFQCSTGVILELRPVPGGRILKAKERVPRPKPPIIPPKEEGQEPLENHADPRYMAAMDEYARITQEIGLNITLFEGTRVLSVPEGMFMPDDDRWIDYVEDAELVTFDASRLVPNYGTSDPKAVAEDASRSFAPEVHRTGKLRHVDYLVQYALGEGDYLVLLNQLTAFAGKVLEKDVDDAEDSFRNPQGRSAPTRLPSRPRPGRTEG